MTSNGSSIYSEKLNEAYAIRSSNLPKSISLADAVLQAATREQDDISIAKAANLLSLFHAVQCNFDESIQFANKALVIATQQQDIRILADAYYNLASVHYRRDNFHLGLDYLLKCLRLYTDLNDHHNLARVNKSMGTVYEYFGDYASAETAYKLCIAASQAVNDQNSESNAYNPLSGLLIKKGQIQEAADMVALSIALKEKTNDRRGLGFALYARGKVLLAQEHYLQAINEFEKAIQIHASYNDSLGLGMAYNKLSVVHYLLGNNESALEKALKAQSIAQQNGIEFLRFKSFHQLYRIAKQQGNMEEAFSYLEKYVEAKENVINERTRNIIKSYGALAEIERLEKEATTQKEKAEIIERKNDELDSFFYRVSHDLKGPIASLMGLYNLAKMEVKDEAAQQYLSMFNGQTLRINNIVLGLIDLINLRNEAARVQIDFASLVDECITSCFYLEKFSSVKIFKNIQPNITFYSEWAIVNTILQNLIENAIKYSRGDVVSFVRINIRVEHNQLLISVEDNGEGIPQNLQASMFNMFVRGNSRHKGSGLGLYILHRAVERLKGTIKVESKLYEGSIFTVSLPLT